MIEEEGASSAGEGSGVEGGESEGGGGVSGGALAERVRVLEAELAEAKGRAESLSRRREAERIAAAAGAIDAEAVAMVVEAMLAGDGRLDAGAAVRELKRRAPVLFGGSAGPAGSGGSVMSARVGPSGGGESGAAALRERAAKNGDRVSLIRYLRAKRG